MGALQVFQYNENPIEFEVINGKVMANATAMCSAFDKKVKDFLKTSKTKRYINRISERTKIPSSEIVQVRHGNNGCTWLHEKIVLKLAQWLDVDFEIWCDEKIAELLKNGKVELTTQQLLEANQRKILELQESNEDLRAKGTYEFEARHKKEKELKLLKKQMAMQEDKQELNQMYRK